MSHKNDDHLGQESKEDKKASGGDIESLAEASDSSGTDVTPNPVSETAGKPEMPVVVRDFTEENPFYHILNQVVDPETGVGVADMGLLYRVTEEDGLVSVCMTLTSMGCPAGPEITTDIDGVLRLQPDVKDVEIEIVWEPAWNPDFIKQEVKEMLWGLG